MVNKNKRKGDAWERELVKILNEKIIGADARRIPGSGSIGTYLNLPILQGDVVLKVDDFPKEFKFEAKVGYGGSTQMAVKKEWFDKVAEEAERTFSIPAVASKFSGARDGTKQFVALDMDIFCDIINYVTELKREIEKLEKEKENK